jgi:hypothetical protein
MSVRKRLAVTRGILVELTTRDDCMEITGYGKNVINDLVEAVDRVLHRYRSESARISRCRR